MRTITCSIDDRAYAVLQRLSVVRNRSIENIAGDIIEEEAITHLPGGQRHMYFHHRIPLDLGDVQIGMVEHRDGSIGFTP